MRERVEEWYGEEIETACIQKEGSKSQRRKETGKMEERGIDPLTSRMLSERSTI